MNENSFGFMYLKNKFPNASDVEIKEDIYVGSHITELMQYVNFEGQHCELDKAVWRSFKNNFQLSGKSYARKIS